MNENFKTEIESEVARITDLPLDEQTEAFARLRDELERALSASVQEAAE